MDEPMGPPRGCKSPYCEPPWCESCRSSVPGMPRKVRATTNPYGRGHNWVKLRFQRAKALDRLDALTVPCCENEDRTMQGGCKNCGDPCL